MCQGKADVSGEGSSGGAGGATRAPWILLTCRSYYGYPTDTSVGTDHRHICVNVCQILTVAANAPCCSHIRLFTY